MPRAIWTGAINFGLVTIPVGLFSATEDHTVSFHQFQRGTADRVRYLRVNERTGKEVDYSEIVKGRDVGGGDHVIVEPSELEQIAPGRSRTIDITSFVDLDEIDPVYFRKTYWLAPTQESYHRPYRLLVEALTATNRAGVATFVMRNRQYLTALRADNGVLALDTLHWADEVRDPGQLRLPETGSARGNELEMARTLIESMSGSWKPEEYRDTYTDRVEQLIADKRAGREVVTEEAPREATEVVDLLEALQRSVDSSRRDRGGTSGRSRSRSDQGAPKPAGGRPKSGGGRKARARPAEDLSAMRKADLDAMARELGIKGRSKMTREELQKAVAAANEPSGRKAAS
jgi:DNA end-binding protein Ku